MKGSSKASWAHGEDLETQSVKGSLDTSVISTEKLRPLSSSIPSASTMNL